MLLNLRVMAGQKAVNEFGTDSTSFDHPVPRRQPRPFINSVGIFEGTAGSYPYPAHTSTVRDALDKVFESHHPTHQLK